MIPLTKAFQRLLRKVGRYYHNIMCRKSRNAVEVADLPTNIKITTSSIHSWNQTLLYTYCVHEGDFLSCS